jgi:hypothetical protein
MRRPLLLSTAVALFAATESATSGDPPPITIDLSPPSSLSADDPSETGVAYSVKPHLSRQWMSRDRTPAIELGDFRMRLTVLGAAALGAVIIPVLPGWA